jgi:ketosteroid isomerase-like protein/quercetin dioxygenase-like cupin family protein
VLVGVVASLVSACTPAANVEQERSALLALDREWSQSVKSPDKFASYFAPDASMHPPGMPAAKGTAAIKDTLTKVTAMPGFTLAWTADRAEVTNSADLGLTSGTYKATMAGMTENGTYVTVWKRQPDRSWKVYEDIATPSAYPQPPSTQHVMTAPAAVKWTDAPPSLPKGAQIAVIAGDPTQPQPFVIRVQMPSGYRIAPHWHPADENITVLSGTLAIGMGDKFDESALTNLAEGGYSAMPREMRHYVMARGATTVQIHSMGPIAINYVDPADDPSKGTR